jgi:hypothetical protein
MTYDAAVTLAPADLTFEEADIGSLPLHDDDIRTEQGYPAEAAQLEAFAAWTRRTDPRPLADSVSRHLDTGYVAEIASCTSALGPTDVY